ncbi:unnamed protein product [Phytophthora fragariaefolia]|uniref:Unnamed protein product n=1 Tax=Phytophthora fragariaefolia TaxID=1490495 RepID=A0A9W6X7E2_9STRA|nr:unnamed protein product [Phytophthora fragariaefolia]
MVFGLRNEVSQEQLREVLERYGLLTTSIAIQLENGTYAEVEFADASTAEAAVTRFGREGSDRLKVGHIPLYLKQKVPSSSRGRFKCGELNHFIRECPTLVNSTATNRGQPLTRYHEQGQQPGPQSMDLAEASTGTLATMETMVSKMLDVKLSGIRASIDELARQTMKDNIIDGAADATDRGNQYGVYSQLQGRPRGIRTGKGRALWVLGTYVPHSPELHQDDVYQEWEWLQQIIADGRAQAGLIVMAGDFNTYTDETLDRQSTGERSSAAREMSARFREWLEAFGMSSTFRRRRSSVVRFTYERNQTRTALDDIFISNEHAATVKASGVWLRSITSSDHVGTPFCTMQCERGNNIARTLANVQDIRVVNTRLKTKLDMVEFREHTNILLQVKYLELIPDIDEDTVDLAAILQWLEDAIQNLNECLYTSGKILYGESSQTRRQLARSVCVRHPLDTWIPPAECTVRPRYLDSLRPEDAEDLPQFAKEWILPDTEEGGRFKNYWVGAHAWEHYSYTAERPAEIDKLLKKHVAPGYGGVSQEMWINAPSRIRERERKIIELILRTGAAPQILKRKQMIFLPKQAHVDPTLDNSKGLPPWRPITVLAALANRLCVVVKQYCVSPACGVDISTRGSQEVARITYAEYTIGTQTTSRISPQVGDGSVLNTTRANASGGLTMCVEGGPIVMGKMNIHATDITSTRCEVHDLIAGMINSGDAGTQICDNKSAIVIFQKARRCARGGKPCSYRDPHRIEVRSLVQLMQANGTMDAHWVRFHQEHVITDDVHLQQNREALAFIDEAARASLSARMTTSYAEWLALDKWMIIDTADRLIFGNTLAQGLFIPAFGHAMAQQLGLPPRALWKDRAGEHLLWSVMVQLTDVIWVHAALLAWLGMVPLIGGTQRAALVRALQAETRHPNLAPAGRLRPHYLTAPLRMLYPVVGRHDALISQITPGWGAVTLAHVPDARIFDGLRHLRNPDRVRVWWVDDIYTPQTEGWWEDFQSNHHMDNTYWIGTYTNTPGYSAAHMLGVKWMVRIPAGLLRMRKDYSVVQSRTQQHEKCGYSKNGRTICIGIIAEDGQAQAFTAWPLWRCILAQYYSDSWLVENLEEDHDESDTYPVLRHPVFELVPLRGHSDPHDSEWWSAIRQQLNKLDLVLYSAPIGWKRYLTMTKHSVTWVEAISFTQRRTYRLHTAYFNQTWEILCDYWNGICTQSRDEHNTEELLQDVNAGIKERRCQHARSTLTSTSRMLVE